MKKKSLKYNSILLIITIIIFSSCIKEDKNDNISNLISPLFIQKAPINIEKLLKNPNNTEDEEVNSILYESAYNLKESLSSNIINKMILDTLFKTNTSIKYNELPNNINKFKSKIIDNVTYKQCSYEIVIDLFNRDNYDINLNPIILIGSDIYSQNQAYDNYVAGWKLNSDNKWEEIIINEEIAKSIRNPIYIINIDEINSNKKEQYSSYFYDNKSKTALLSSLTTEKIKIDNINIAYAYDDDNSSEVCFKYLIIINGKTQMYPTDIDIADVSKSEINSNKNVDVNIFYHDDIFGGPNLFDFGLDQQIRIVGVTYEYDWYASKKWIYVNEFSFYFRAKYSNEYYQRVDIIFPQNRQTNYTITVNEKGSIKFMGYN
jgi:hypothetical protein